MLIWFENQKGFIDYQCFENGCDFSDIITYDSEASAKRINDDFYNTSTCKEMIALIDSDFRGFTGRKIDL